MNDLCGRLKFGVCGSALALALFAHTAEQAAAQTSSTPFPTPPPGRSASMSLRGGGPAPSVTSYTVLNVGTAANPIYINTPFASGGSLFPTNTTLPYAPVTIRPLPYQIPTASTSLNAALSSSAARAVWAAGALVESAVLVALEVLADLAVVLADSAGALAGAWAMADWQRPAFLAVVLAAVALVVVALVPAALVQVDSAPAALVAPSVALPALLRADSWRRGRRHLI